ncbi:sulfate permease 2 [Massariosphaeria phaeospora]|uniref:Sulfate permease 2 n=1 Tax=Massariosphaeria phaeospora TaxID=100035 RepID=A0A7C8M0T9_9PLEO|nr:sulfate permease 2 [Massariosphaeria phaeospora]
MWASTRDKKPRQSSNFLICFRLSSQSDDKSATHLDSSAHLNGHGNIFTHHAMGVKKTGNFILTKVLGIDLVGTHQKDSAELQKRAKETLGNAYVEDDPSVSEWLHSLRPTRNGAKRYLRDLFPFLSWTRRYNLHWMMGDAIAGLTVGLVVVPQAMAYALLARLTPEYGLYTSFTGAVLYWLFGTSKDIVIGTTAVGSLLVGSVISKVEDARPGVYSPVEIAHTLSFLAGIIVLFLGLFRLGWIVEFIPYVPISAFVTSASITIMLTQIPVALGIRGVNTREAPYMVLANTMKGLPRVKLDAAIGLTSIALLFAIRDGCVRMEVRQPAKKRMWSMLSSLRLTFTVLLYTLISWLVHRTAPEGHTKFRIVGKIESGFKHASIPTMDTELFTLVAAELPAIVIILIVEHIAIAKSFGRTFGYTVIPSQEILAQGVANILSPFMGGYVCTGSFGASAVLSKAGVRTPLAGVFSAMVLVLSLYALTKVFYFIPNAALAGLIIHATCNLVTPPKDLVKYWQLSPFELLIWIVGVVLALFLSLETSIYATIGLSFASLLLRMARTPGHLSGRARVSRVVDNSAPTALSSSLATTSRDVTERRRDVYVALQGKTSQNPKTKVEPPYPGVFIYRFSENFNYLNQALHMDHLLSHVLEHTRRTKTDDGIAVKDRLWSDTPPPAKLSAETACLPVLRAIILDFSAVNSIDIQTIQGLIDLRNGLDKYATPAIVEWHFAGVHNRWTRRALAISGFGYPATDNADAIGNWCPAYTVSRSLAGATAADERQREQLTGEVQANDEERRAGPEGATVLKGQGRRISKEVDRTEIAVRESVQEKLEPIFGVDRPFFHVDLVDAVDTAVRDAKMRDGAERAESEMEGAE